MSAVKSKQSEGIPGAGIPEQAVKKILTGSAALSLPSPFAFFSRSFSQFTLSPLSRNLEQANAAIDSLAYVRNNITSIQILKRGTDISYSQQLTFF